MQDYSDHIISYDASLNEALEKLNRLKNLTLFIVNKNQELIGTLTDGDVRRGFLKGLTMNEKVDEFMSKQFHSLTLQELSVHKIKNIRKQLIQLLPIIDEQGKIIKVIDFKDTQTLLPVDAVIMAGGRGERLRPLTDSTPKPMLKLGDKTIIGHEIDLLSKYGIENIFITVRYLGNQIIEKIGDGKERGVNIHYYTEQEPRGTVGSVGRITNLINDTVLILNSDLYTNINLEEFFTHFTDTGADMSIASISQNISLSYAVLEVKNQDILSLDEKPTYTYNINTGIYLIKREMLNYIPKDQPYDATDLIYDLLRRKKKIVTFPLMGYWIDIGKHEDYKKAQELVNFLTNFQ